MILGIKHSHVQHCAFAVAPVTAALLNTVSVWFAVFMFAASKPGAGAEAV